MTVEDALHQLAAACHRHAARCLTDLWTCKVSLERWDTQPAGSLTLRWERTDTVTAEGPRTHIRYGLAPAAAPWHGYTPETLLTHPLLRRELVREHGAVAWLQAVSAWLDDLRYADTPADAAARARLDALVAAHRLAGCCVLPDPATAWFAAWRCSCLARLAALPTHQHTVQVRGGGFTLRAVREAPGWRVYVRHRSCTNRYRMAYTVEGWFSTTVYAWANRHAHGLWLTPTPADAARLLALLDRLE